MSWLWLTQDVINVTWVKKAVQLRLRDQWIANWRSNLATKSLCNNYRMFKLDYGMECYIEKLQKTSRIYVTKLRTLNNKLPVNVGRYHGVSREDRLCSKCDAGVVGDEYHVIFDCTDRDIVRLKGMYLSEFFTYRPTYFKYVSLMQSTSGKVLQNLSLFLKLVLNVK